MGSAGMKSVCIVGGGPAGLVAAKTFLDTGRFIVTVCEQSDRIGGIWALDEGSQEGFLPPHTPTNLSRFTVGFSDLDWNEVDVRSTPSSPGQATRMPQVPMFPKAWQVNRYLEEYRKRYLPESIIHLGTMEDRQSFWKIRTKDRNCKEATQCFDYLTIASGFFSVPRPPKSGVPDLVDGKDKLTVRTMHSSQFRSIDDLFSGASDAGIENILIVGGGNSSGETAAAVAMQLSDTQWSPDQSRRKRYEKSKVIHVTPRPLYALPPINEYDKDSKTFLPLDFKLYDLAKRPPMESYGGRQTPEVRDMVHNALQTMVGGDQSDLGSKALVSHGKGAERGAVYVALSESYPEFVREGLIEVVPGRVTSVRAEAEGAVTAVIEHGEQCSELKNVGALIYATGYTPSAALDFLADDVKAALKYDPTSVRLPLILEQWQTMNRSVPSAAFLGFYEGPYWPMLEMQARLTASRWVDSGDVAPQRPYEETEKLLQMRTAMKDRALDVGQYWFSDYLGYLEDIADHLKLPRNHGQFREKEGCPTPARYLPARTDRAQADAVMQDLYKVWHDCVDNGRFVARAVLRAMHGNWEINRRIVSADPSYSGSLQGTASFHPRFPTKDKIGKVFDMEYLYAETGTFTTASGLSMTASRRYVYRYSEADDQLSVWFVKPDNDLEVDYLFHDLSFISPAEARKADACVAKADHLCVEDMYWTEYTLPMEAIVLRRCEVKHTVKGPQKDYVATTLYNRPSKECR